MADAKATVEITAIDSATRVINQIGASVKGLEKSYSSLQATLATVGAGFSIDKLVEETLAWEQASNRLNATLMATGNAVGLTRTQLDDLAKEVSGSTPFSDTDLRNAEANLLKFGNIHDQVFTEALKLSADYAAFTGGTVAEASQALGRALADPTNGVRALQREFGNLTFSQKEYIAQLEAQGKTEEAQAAILEIIRNKIGGAAAGSNTGITGFVGQLAKAWDAVAEAADGAIKQMKKAPDTVPKWLQGPYYNQSAQKPPAAPLTWDEQMARQTAEQNAMVAKAAEAIDRQRQAHAAAVPVLKQWTAQLAETSKEETALTLIQQGAARTWSLEDQQRLLAIARLMDLRKVYASYTQQAVEYAAAQDQANQAQTSFNDLVSESQKDSEFRISLIGKTTVEVEKLTAAHNIELEALRKEGQVNAELFPAQFQAIVQQAKDAVTISNQMIDARRQAERSWATGTKTAFDEYIDHATNAAEQSKMLFGDAFKNMEDALVAFVMTGKLNFTDLANSIIADIVRIQIRAGLANVAAGSSSLFAGLFGGDEAPVQLSGPVAHAGGVIGADAFPMRTLPASTWHGAPRYHLGVDEVPAILQRGETVLPKGAKGAGGTYYIDARGADSAGMARLEAMIRQVNGSIEYRAVGAVQRAYNQRGAKTPLG